MTAVFAKGHPLEFIRRVMLFLAIRGERRRRINLTTNLNSVAPRPNYCAAPWVSGVLRINGETSVCCRSGISIGNWQDNALQDVYNSDTVKSIRRSIASGRFPDAYCMTCYRNGQAKGMDVFLLNPIQNACSIISTLSEIETESLQNLTLILDKKKMDWRARSILIAFRENLGAHAASTVNLQVKPEELERFQLACHKLVVCADVIETFLVGATTTKYPAPFRESNVIAVCNARCIQCPGRFTNEISIGKRLPDGTLFREMNSEMLDKSLEQDDSIVDFFVNGSEFLFYRNWRKVAIRLRDSGVRIRVATNGMLLTKTNTDYLLENQLISRLNISMDGGTKTTLESIRRRVKYNRILENYEYFLERAASIGYQLPVSTGFVLMTLNYHELPAMVELLYKVSKKQELNTPLLSINCLGLRGGPKYQEFVHTHHHSNIDSHALRTSFEDALTCSTELKIPVLVLHRYKLQTFVDLGCPLPKLNFLAA